MQIYEKSNAKIQACLRFLFRYILYYANMSDFAKYKGVCLKNILYSYHPIGWDCRFMGKSTIVCFEIGNFFIEAYMLQKFFCCVIGLFLTVQLYGQTEVVSGLFTTYRKEDRILWSLPKCVFGRDMSLTTTIIEAADRQDKSADDKFGYVGDRFGPNIIRFELERDFVVVKQVGDYINGLDGSSPKEVFRECAEPVVLQEFKVLERKGDEVLIDVTQWLEEGKLWSLRPFFFLLGLGAEQAKAITEIVGLSDGVIVRSERVYGALDVMSEGASQEKTRWKIGCCLNLLPCDLMSVRYASPNVGYFDVPYLQFDKNALSPTEKRVVQRWRLEVADEDSVRYNHGDLVEPKQKIVMYVDRKFPRQWWPYILKAVDNWNAVFENCGFKNAIEGKIAPDSVDYVLDNASLSWIVYKTGPMENAYGRSYVDFRTGEILSCHIAIFHSVFNMLCRWYVSQIGKEPECLTDEIAGKLLEMVVTHEIGHTLGLTHNFYGSSVYNLSELKDSSLMHQFRHGSSIMDYMRLNYAASDEDGLSVADRIPQIGAYDTLAIEWGYRCFPGCTPQEETVRLDSWLREKQKERKYRFQDAFATMPEAQAEDLGRVSLETAQIGIEKLFHLGVISPDIDKWGRGAWAVAEVRNRGVHEQYVEYLNQALGYIGGCRKCWEDASSTLETVSGKEQKRALSFLQKYALAENDMWPLEWREEWAKTVVDGLVYRSRYIADCERNGIGEYTVSEYLDEISEMLFAADMNRAWYRFLLWNYTNSVSDFVKSEGRRYPEIAGLLKEGLQKMDRCLKKFRGSYWDSWRKNINLIIEMR